MKKFSNPDVAAVFDSYTPEIRSRLMLLRQLVFDTAAATAGVGEVQETLKWGEPAYVTVSKIGSTIRMDRKKSETGKYAIYFNCNTTLVDTFRTIFPDDFVYEGNRAIVFDQKDRVPVNKLRICIEAALTYHQDRKKNLQPTPRTQKKTRRSMPRSRV